MLFEFFKTNYAKGNHTNRFVIFLPGSDILCKDGITASGYLVKGRYLVSRINHNVKCGYINFYETFKQIII